MRSRKPFMIVCAAAAAAIIVLAAVKFSDADQKDPGLKTVYRDSFDVGCAVTVPVLSVPKLADLIKKQFNVITLENELKPDSVLDIEESRRCIERSGDETAAAVHFDQAKQILDFAQRNGLKVHGHTLLWHDQTPEEFFHESYDQQRPFVSRDIMLGRMENYIRGVMEYLDSCYPGLIVSWDVVNEAVNDEGTGLRESLWMTVVGEDYCRKAFEYTRKYAPEGTLLYCNDYDTADPERRKVIIGLLKTLISDGTIDGYGFQMHCSIGDIDAEQISATLDEISGLGLRLRISEMDIAIEDDSESSYQAQAQMYAKIMKILKEHSDQIEAVQVWGIRDDLSWRKEKHPLLFDEKGEPKPAFYAFRDPDLFLQDPQGTRTSAAQKSTNER